MRSLGWSEILASDTGGYQSLRVKYPTPLVGERIRGWRGKSQSQALGNKGITGVSISLHLFILALKRHFRVSNLCHWVGWGKLPLEQPPPPAGCFWSEQSLWALPEAQPLLPGTQSLGGEVGNQCYGARIPRGCHQRTKFCMIHSVWVYFLIKRGKAAVRHYPLTLLPRARTM